jgi:hypothetical protein
MVYGFPNINNHAIKFEDDVSDVMQVYRIIPTARSYQAYNVYGMNSHWCIRQLIQFSVHFCLMKKAVYFFYTLALLVITMPLIAGEIQQATIRHQDGMYILKLHVELAAPYSSVHAIVTNYDKLYRISEVLTETRLLSEPGSKIKKRRMVIQTCILFFCFNTKMVEHVWETENTIITKIIPEQSDYKYGKTEWQIIPIDKDRSRIQLYCELEPAFWIPPYIGPFLLKQKMMSEAKKTINRIEILSING